MYHSLKTLLRDLLPLKYQVPAKYWYGRLRGGLEEEMALLPLIVQNHCRVLDIGGNRGAYAYCLWRLGAKVEVFEPNPKCYRVLAAWAASQADVNIHSVALSSHKGEANLHIPIDESGEEHDASASIEHTEFTNARDELVTLKTLDSYKFEKVDLIKIDVEGHEYKVIEGAESTITESKPALLIEIEQRHSAKPIDKVFEKILGFGYKGFFLEDEELLPLEKFDLAVHQSIESFGSKKRYINNFLFLHESRLAHEEYLCLTKIKKDS